MRRPRHLRLLATGVGATLIVLSLAPAGASSANISHSYHATDSITNGSIVSLDPKRSDYVQPANTQNGSRLIGVAVAMNDSLLAVDPNTSDVQVATSGIATALVSTLNGDIGVGDQVAASPFSGVGMKAIPGSQVIGLAQTAFKHGSEGSTTQEITSKDGKKTKVGLGYVRLTIAIGASINSAGGPNLNILQKLAKSLTGHSVSTARVAASIVVVLVSLVALITLVYASIYGSIISIGRNPLAKYEVFRTLTSVLAMALLTALVGSLTVFFLLR